MLQNHCIAGTANHIPRISLNAPQYEENLFISCVQSLEITNMYFISISAKKCNLKKSSMWANKQQSDHLLPSHVVKAYFLETEISPSRLFSASLHAEEPTYVPSCFFNSKTLHEPNFGKSQSFLMNLCRSGAVHRFSHSHIEKFSEFLSLRVLPLEQFFIDHYTVSVVIPQNKTSWTTFQSCFRKLRHIQTCCSPQVTVRLSFSTGLPSPNLQRPFSVFS